MMQERTNPKLSMRRIVAIVAVVLLVPIALVYLTYQSAGWEPSYCFQASRFISSKEKIANATAYFDELTAKRPAIQVVRDQSRPCCRIDKGGSEDPPLGIWSYLVDGSSQYVHIPARYRRNRNVVSISDELIIINRCGKPLYYGAHP